MHTIHTKSPYFRLFKDGFTCIFLALLLIFSLLPAYSYADPNKTDVAQEAKSSALELADPEANDTQDTEPSSDIGLFAAGDLQLSMRWLDAPAGQETSQTWSSPTQSRENQIIKYSLGIQTNNVSYDTGQLVMKVKLPIWADRNGTNILPSMIGIPQAPAVGDASIPFNYTIVGDELVIRNTAPLDSAGNYSIQVQYNLNPWNTIDMKKSTFQVRAEVPSSGSTPEEFVSNEIDFTMNTEAKPSKFVKSDPQPMYYWDQELTGGKPMPADFANYRWVSWRLAMSGTSNQPYRVEIEDIASPDGELFSLGKDTRYPQNALEPGDFNITGPNTIVSNFFEDPNTLGPASGADRYLRVLVRYPLGNDGDLLTNKAIEKVVGKDLLETSTPLESESNYTWKNFQLNFDGPPTRMVKYSDTIDRNDREVWSKMVLLRNGLPVDLWWGMVGDFDLYPGFNYPAGQTYSGEITDDFANFKLVDGTANTSSDPWVRMTENDYYYDRTRITLNSYTVNRTTGQREYYQQGQFGPLLKVWAKTTNSSDWVEVDRFYAGDVAYSDGAGGMNLNPTREVALPVRTTAVKTTFENAVDHLTVRMDLYGAIRGNSSSATLRSWFANPANDNRRLRLQNFGYYKVTNQDGSSYTTPPTSYTFSDSQGNNRDIEAEDRANHGSLLNRATAQIEILDMVGRSDSVKLASSPINDVTNRMVDVQFWLNNIEAFQGITDGEFDELLAAGWQPPSRDEAIFYDLLPLGTFYNATKTKAVYDIKGSPSTSSMEVETVNNFRGTGRQLVILKVKANTAGQNYVNTGDVMRPVNNSDGTVSIGPSTWNQRGASGYSVMFTASIPWDNVPYARNSVNNAAYQVPENKPLLGNGVPDDGRGNTVMGSDGRPAFYDLRGNGVTNVNDTQYMNLLTPINVAVSTGAGLSKLVRADSAEGLDPFNTTTKVELGEGYTYQLRVGAAENTQMRDVVLFDILENAATAGETAWKGTFDSINLNYAQQTGVNPIVYYSTTSGLTTTGLSPSSLSDTSVWSTTMPTDKSTITAIAVDLRKATNGSDFVFPSQGGTQVLVHMIAPTTRQTAFNAYNQASYYSTTVPNVGDPSSALQTTTRTAVRIPLLTKSSNPAGGSNSDNATTVTSGQQITYTLTYNTGLIGSDALIVFDIVPVGLTLVPGSIRFTSPNSTTAQTIPNTAYNSSNRTITWPSYTQTARGAATFSFTVTVDALPNGSNGVDYRLYQNQATAKRGTDRSEISETVTHQQLNRWATITKTASLIEGVTSTSPDAASGGTSLAQNPGSVDSPVRTALGQVVEYYMTVSNSGANQLSGIIDISDVVPANTTYIPGSARIVFEGGVSPSQATSTINDSSTTLSWSLNQMSHGEVAHIRFRVAAPTTAFQAGETATKAQLVFSNSAQLSDRAKNDTAQSPTTYHVVGETKVVVKKTWVDDAPGDIQRPDGILVQLFANNTVYGGPVRVTSADNWQRLWSGLPRWNEDGTEIIYTAAEVGDPGDFQTSYSNDTFSITNHYSPGWTSRTIVKAWEDDNNADGKRPSSIQVQLLADGVNYRDPAVLNAENNWQYVFNDLPVTRNDVPIVYTYKEFTSIPSYKTSYNEELGIITNTLVKDPPVVDPPIVDPPVVDPPVVDPPVVDPPVVDPPVVDPPIVDPPIVDPPVVDPPVVDPPIVDPPVVDPPIVDPPDPIELDDPIIIEIPDTPKPNSTLPKTGESIMYRLLLMSIAALSGTLFMVFYYQVKRKSRKIKIPKNRRSF